MPREKKEKESRLKVIPLGGIGEIGKNMTVVEYEDDLIVVDCGLSFPREDMLGIDVVIPDVTYLVKNKARLRGFMITHGHEDHIGAVGYVLKQVEAPIYGSRLSMALIEGKLKEHRINNAQLNVVKPGETRKFGKLSVEFIRMSHSITGAMALAIHSPVGTVLFTGDFKVDFTPIDNERMDFGAIARLGTKGLLALFCDSTNAERPGYTMSERTVGETFNNLFAQTKGRIFVAMFASNVHRIQQVVNSAVKYGRKVCFVGRSMVNVSKIAMQLGDLVIPEGQMIEMDDLGRYDDDELAILTTGSQGEPMSGLSRMANSEHRKIEITSADTIIISATPIPGNEKFVSRIINQLLQKGAHVVYESLAEVHVSGHACQEELKLMHALSKPKFFVPVHGEYRHLYRHAQLAQQMGMPEKNILIPESGSIIEFTRNSMKVTGTAPTGEVMVDGLGIGDVGSIVLRDRKHLSEDGLMIVVVSVDKTRGTVESGPDIISRGFVYVREAEELLEEARAVVRRVIKGVDLTQVAEWAPLKTRIRDELHRYLYEKTKRNPMILPIVMEV